MKSIFGKTTITMFLAFGMAVLLNPANATPDFTGKDGEKKSNSTIQLDPEMMALIEAAPEEVADDDPNKAAKSKEIFTITDLTDLAQLPATVMGGKTPQNTYDLIPTVFSVNPISMQSFSFQLQTADAAPATVTVYNDNGGTVKTMRIKNPSQLQNVVLETGTLAKGTYFVEVSQGLKSCYKIVRKNY